MAGLEPTEKVQKSSYWVGMVGCGIVRVTGLTVSRIKLVLARVRAKREGAKATKHRLPTVIW